MELVLRKDMDKLIGDTRNVKQGLEVLERDHASWARDQEHKDLMKMFEGVKGLEFDVSVMMGDYVSLGQTKRNDVISGDLHQAYKHLNILFEDLKKVRDEMDKSYEVHNELAQLEIDWARFRKTVLHIQEDLEGK